MPQGGAVLAGGDAVQRAEALQKAAVVRKAAGGAGVQHAEPRCNGVAAVLHTQVGQVAVYAFQRVLLKYAGQMLAAGVGISGKLRDSQLRVGVVGLQVGDRLGDQQAGGGGRRR